MIETLIEGARLGAYCCLAFILGAGIVVFIYEVILKKEFNYE